MTCRGSNKSSHAGHLIKPFSQAKARQDHARLAVFVRASHSSRLGAKARSRLAFAFEAPRN